MSHEEKARELIDKFIQYSPAEEEFELEYAKQSALICVNEIINNYEQDDKENQDCHWLNSGAFKYWDKVKQSIKDQ